MIGTIYLAVEEMTGVKASEIMARDRRAPVVYARRMVCWLIHHLIDISLKQVAKHVCYMDHSTALHHISEAERRRQGDDLYRQTLDDLVRRVQSLMREQA